MDSSLAHRPPRPHSPQGSEPGWHLQARYFKATAGPSIAIWRGRAPALGRLGHSWARFPQVANPAERAKIPIKVPFVKHTLLLLLLASAAPLLAQAPKVAFVNLEQALVATTDGQNAEKKLDARFTPRKAALDQKHKELMALQDKLDKGTESDEERKRLAQEIDQKGDDMDKETTQADADLAEAQRQVLRELGPKLMAVVVRYAKQHGYDVVLDVGSSDMPRLYAENSTDITKEVVEEYEKSAANSRK